MTSETVTQVIDSMARHRARFEEFCRSLSEEELARQVPASEEPDVSAWPGLQRRDVRDRIVRHDDDVRMRRGIQGPGSDEQLTPAQADFFEKKIRPVLVKECYKCHSAEGGRIKGGLRVDTRDGLLKGLNLDATIALAEAISIPVIASGGFASIADVKALLEHGATEVYIFATHGVFCGDSLERFGKSEIAGIVVTENAFRYIEQHGIDTRDRAAVWRAVLESTRLVGRPVFFAMAIILLAFVPVFSLTGQEGLLFHPLAFTKTVAVLAATVMAVTLVPVLCTLLLAGQMHAEEDNAVMRALRADGSARKLARPLPSNWPSTAF